MQEDKWPGPLIAFLEKNLAAWPGILGAVPEPPGCALQVQAPKAGLNVCRFFLKAES
jgi:hypothetical protein